MQKIYIIAAVCMPNILLFNIFNRQDDDVHVVFSHVLILAGLLSVVGVAQFFILKRFAGKEVSIIVMAAFWAFFWYYGAIRRTLFTEMSGYVLASLIAFALIALLIFLIWLRPSFEDFQPVFYTLSAVLLIMFVVNASPAFYRNVFLSASV